MHETSSGYTVFDLASYISAEIASTLICKAFVDLSSVYLTGFLCVSTSTFCYIKIFT